MMKPLVTAPTGGITLHGGKPPLTSNQQRIFDYICKYIEENGYPPAIRDIGRAFDIASPNGVMCHLRALQKKGYIHRDEKNDERGGRARAITIPGVSAGGYSLPLLGIVSAGKTIETEQQHDRLEMKELFTGPSLYALKVRGTSMIDNHIADGDYVVIKRQESADNGEKVVAMIDKAMTLKKFYRRKDHIRLEPCNTTMDAILVDPSVQNVAILGILVGVIRKC
jgi:repressor LexA